MILKVTLKDGDNFIKTFLFDAIYNEFLKVYNVDRASKMDKYLDDSDVNLSVYDILNEAFSTLVYTSHGNEYTISIDETVMLEGHNLYTLVKLIEFGNIEVKGLRIVTKVFDYIADHILDIYSDYLGVR